MKFFLIVAGLTLTLPFIAQAGNVTRYELTILNGGHMPISPAAIYVKTGVSSSADIGKTPSRGFVQLCQTGNPAGRVPELNAEAGVTFLTQTTSPIMPGESRVIEVDVQNPAWQSIHFEAMYGKSKDACSVATIDGVSLRSLSTHLAMEHVSKDNVLLTGAFADPALPSMNGSSDSSVCGGVGDAVSCLRTLSPVTSGTAAIHYFTPYFPSLINFLEAKYGTADVDTLIIPSAGAVQLRLKLK